MTILLGTDKRKSGSSSLSFAWVGRRPMIPPVGMTKGRVALSVKIDEWLKETAGPLGFLRLALKRMN
jgi:hypothetical protein